ncbi:MAG TPA: ATP-dependent DNA ligase [Candidatus Methanoperedenaceae archaeon]|nr:ATP-dependent DNA ligase [Candidatus Methanoperedenaceae archaeon]
MSETTFSAVAVLCDTLARTASRREKIRLIKEFLLRLKEDEIAPAVAQIIGTIFPEDASTNLEIGYSTVKRISERKRQTTLFPAPLTILEVREYLNEIAALQGSGSRERKEKLLESLLGRAGSLEVSYIIRMIFKEMEHGVSEGLMLEAIAEAARVEPELVSRANMLSADIGEVARIAILKGRTELEKIQLVLFRPVKPMLAEMAYSIDEVFEEGSLWAFEYKFDGARIQIHMRGKDVRIFSRRLSDVTSSLPEIAELARELGVEEAVLEGEAIAVKDGRPLPFQELMRRFRRVHEIDAARMVVAVRLYLFDLLYRDGKTTIDMPYTARRALLAEACPSLLAEMVITQDRAKAEVFLKRALDEGHEGLMAKAPDSPYTPGKRGKKWFKLKPCGYP